MYLEIEAVQAVEIDETDFEDLHNDVLAPRDKLFATIEQNKKRYSNAINYVAGFLGLKLHKQLVSIEIIEQRYIYLENNKGTAFQGSTQLTFLLDFTLDLKSDWANKLAVDFQKRAGHVSMEHASSTFSWLLRAWAAQDNVLKYVSYFSALERSIPSLPDEASDEWSDTRTAIVDLVNKSEDIDVREQMLKFLLPIMPPNSLSKRFERWARSSELPGWESDIIAFGKFAKTRNLLLHQGNDNVEFQVQVKVDELKHLEDIAERYVSLAIFGDARVYDRKERSGQKFVS